MFQQLMLILCITYHAVFSYAVFVPKENKQRLFTYTALTYCFIS